MLDGTNHQVKKILSKRWRISGRGGGDGGDYVHAFAKFCYHALLLLLHVKEKKIPWILSQCGHSKLVTFAGSCCLWRWEERRSHQFSRTHFTLFAFWWCCMWRTIIKEEEEESMDSLFAHSKLLHFIGVVAACEELKKKKERRIHGFSGVSCSFWAHPGSLSSLWICLQPNKQNPPPNLAHQ